jgi:hypothetical protein
MVARGNADGSGIPEVLAAQELLGAWGIALAVPEPRAAALPPTPAGLTLLRRSPGTRR